jgi:hypothetical protein
MCTCLIISIRRLLHNVDTVRTAPQKNNIIMSRDGTNFVQVKCKTKSEWILRDIANGNVCEIAFFAD